MLKRLQGLSVSSIFALLVTEIT